MTKISRRRKIPCWKSVKEKIEEIMENVPEHTNALSLPYGMQGLYDISHPEPLRILLHPNMNDYDTFLTHHGKAKKFHLNLWTVNQKDTHSEKKSSKVHLNYKLKHIVYVPIHRCFVAFATDLTLRVFSTINFIEMSRVETSHSVLCLYYNACRDDVLAGCLGFVMIWKFPHAQSDAMLPTQKIDCPAILPDYWVKWIRVDRSSRQLLLNCEEAIVILDEETYKLKYNFTIDFRHSLPFTACAFYHPSCYFITGSKDYAVKVWNTSLNQCPLVTSFCGHCNAITALEVDVQHHLVISSSTDKTIRLWCLETLAQTYVLETGEEVHHMELMTSQRLFYQSGEHIRVWNLNHFHTLFTVLGFEIVTSRRVVSRGFPTRLLLQGKDGAIRIVSPSDGTIITTMFPLETLPESIVDYAYSPRENKLYVVLSSGAILVFNTRSNPCSAYQLWKSDVYDGGRVTSNSFAESHGASCVAMMNIDEPCEFGEHETRHYTLLFAGLNNGHISLVYSNELGMHDTIEAHYGQIALLRVSEGLGQNNSIYSAMLVSCGTDCELKVWKVVFRNYAAKIVSLELWSYVKLLSIPRDMETIGYTIGLVMDNNTLITCRVNPEAERPARSRHSHRDSVSRSGLYDIECSTSTAEESHSKNITGVIKLWRWLKGMEEVWVVKMAVVLKRERLNMQTFIVFLRFTLSACPTLGLFATSSDDWSVKIWNKEAKLLKEICFEESLRGVCFANTRGDLLVGFQCHISIVPLTNYLPLKVLEMLSKMDFPDDVFEHHLPFDRMLAFSYDPLRTPSLPLDLEQRRLMLQQEEFSIKTALKFPSQLLTLEQLLNEDDPEGEETNPPIRRYSTTQEQDEVDEKIRKFQRSSMSRRSSAMRSPILEEVIARITQSFSSRSEITTGKVEASSCDLVEQLRRLFNDGDTKIPDDYWPCAPDGFIPNSVVRQRVPPKEVPEHLIPRLLRGEEAREWLKKTRKRSSKDDEGVSDDYYQSISFDDDELGFFSIFDGYDEAAHDVGKGNLLLESSDEEPNEADGAHSSDEENFIQKKWKASTKSLINKERMLANMRAREAVRNKNKVSKKPEMPMIIAAEEEEESDEMSRGEESPEIQSSDSKQDLEDITSHLPLVLRNIINQTWFPKASLVEGVTVEDICEEVISMMNECAPFTYGKICDELLALISCGEMSDEQKGKMLNVVVEKLHHPATAVRRASLKTVQELHVTSNEAVEGILSCLVEGSNDLQNDALKALENLLGIKDKAALWDLLVKANVLSRSPSPDVPTVRGFKFRSIDRGDKRLDKDNYIYDWLALDSGRNSPAKEEKCALIERQPASLEPESRQVKMASSIVSKIKPEPRLSIIDLTFHERVNVSPESLPACSEVREVNPPPPASSDFSDDLLLKLKHTKAGCKLLSRLGYDRTSVDISRGPAANVAISEKVEKAKKIQKKSKREKRPPSALMGFAYGKVGKLSDFEEGDSGESVSPRQEQEPEGFPDIHVSEISSPPPKSEVQQKIDAMVLPKIFNHIKQNRRNSTSSAVERRNGRQPGRYKARIRRLEQEDGLTLAGFDKGPKRPSERISGDGKDKRLDPLLHQGERCKTQSEDLSKAGRRLTLVDSMSTMDCRRRKSTIRKLQKYRLAQKELVSQMMANQECSLSWTPSFRAPTSSEDQILSPLCRQSTGSKSDAHLPKIDIQRTKLPTGVISADVTLRVLSDGTTQVVPSTNVPYSLQTDMVCESLPEGTSVAVKRHRHDVRMSEDRTKSSGADVTRTVLSDDTTQVVPSTDVPYSYTDVSDERCKGRTLLLKRSRGDLRMAKEKTKSSKGVITDDVTRGILSVDAAQITPSTNVPYSLYTDVVGERLSQGTSMMVKRPGDDHRINNEAVRVLPVNPKLTVDTGCNKLGRSRYGVLEVLWASRGFYGRDFEGSLVVNRQAHSEVKVPEKQAAMRVPARTAVVRRLKPIKNHNLISNPYNLHPYQYFQEKLRKLPSISEASLVSPSDSESSRQESETEQLCTLQEILDITRDHCFSRSC